MFVILARFICAMSLHLFNATELSNALKKMKYACNHPWKFIDYKVAFLAGFLQTITIVAVELLNLLIILMDTSILDIVMNHMAIVVISQFGNFFYMASSEKKWKEVIIDSKFGEYLMIQTTTSCLARYVIDGNKLQK